MFGAASSFPQSAKIVEQLHLTEIVHSQAAPVFGSASGLKTAFAAASILVAQQL
jgi:hypothetical protein